MMDGTNGGFAPAEPKLGQAKISAAVDIMARRILRLEDRFNTLVDALDANHDRPGPDESCSPQCPACKIVSTLKAAETLKALEPGGGA
jgi:hypothetical protein